MLYQHDLNQAPLDDLIRCYWQVHEVERDGRPFADALVRGVARHLEEIDGLLASHSTNWKLSRMAAVDKNILRLATFELTRCPDIPVKVTINEAVEIAKRFGTAESGAFVNGILDNIARGVSKPAAPEEGGR